MTNKFLFPFTIVLALVIGFILYDTYDTYKTINSKHILQTDTSIIFLKDSARHLHTTTTIHVQPIYTVSPSIKENVDTASIIRLYFTKYFLVDSLQDSLVKIKVCDTLFKNKILFRAYSYQFLKPYQKTITLNQTNTVTKTVNGFYAGSAFGFENKKIASAGLELNYVTNRFSYGLGYDVLNNSLNAQLLFKINH